MENTKIPWCDHTFNPWVGCSAVSAGCVNCYARTMLERWQGKGAFAMRRQTSRALWRKPVQWNKQAHDQGRRIKVFCGSMCDWLDPQVPAVWLCDLLALIAATPYLDWLMLTKRPEMFNGRMTAAYGEIKEPGTAWHWLNGEYPVNVWFGVTAENQEMWEARVKELWKIPARVRWVSAEPLIGPIKPKHVDWVTVNWVVAGGENGCGARPCEEKWLASLALAAFLNMRPFFFKQWGKKRVGCEGLEAERLEQLREWPEIGKKG